MRTTTAGNDSIHTLLSDELDAVSGGTDNFVSIDFGFARVHIAYGTSGTVCSGGVGNTHCTPVR